MTEIDADRPSYTNDRAQVTEEMVNVYIETMWPDLWSSRRAIGDLRAQVRIGLTAALAAAPKPDRPSAENIGRLVKAAGRALGALQNSSDMISSDINMGYDGKKWAQRPIDAVLRHVRGPVPAEVSEADIATMHMWYNHPDSGATHDARLRSAIAAVFRAHATAPKPYQPTPPPPSSARPENGSATMADAIKAIAAACRPTDHGTMAEAFAAIHTVLSTLVAEREAQARRDERVREAARKLGSETYDVALSALAAALGEDGR